ncbi:MAG: histidine phosphatase family protein [Clostridium sp.]|nr:histidine phosphatase family protein [Clostridium sp.]
MKLYLARHGETDWNIANKIQGQTDTFLNEKGRQQADKLAEQLGKEYRIKEIYASGKARALETANIIGGELGIVPKVKQGLEEISFGKWEGYTWKEVRETFPKEYLIWRTNRRYEIPPMGESYQQLLGRLLPALSDIMEKEREDTLAVTHSAVIMTLMSYLYDTPFEDMARNYKTRNAEIVELNQDLFNQRYIKN